MEEIICKGEKLVDSLGRERIFHGSNICFKNSKRYFDTNSDNFYEKFEKISDKYIETYSKHGINLIRLGFDWDDVEPVEGEFNQKYIDALVKLGKKFEQHNMYFFLDSHQDVWGGKINNGAPEWATYTDGLKEENHMFIWPEGYFYMTWVSNAFNHFWKNDYQLQDKFKNMWSHMIEAFSGNSALMGYDFMNEPYPAPNGRKIFLSIIDNAFYELDSKHYNYEKYFKTKNEKLGFIKMILSIAVCRVRTIGRMKKLLKKMENPEIWKRIVCSASKYVEEFDKTYYTDFIKNMSSTFSDKPTLMEHTYFSNLGIPFMAEKPHDNCIYAPHGYDLWVDTDMYQYANNHRVDVIFDQCKINQKRLNAPVIVAEFGAGAKGEKWYKHIDYLFDKFEENKWSFAYWGLPYQNKSFMKVFTRPYPVAVNGDIISFKNKDNEFTLVFEQKEDNDVETIIFDGKKMKTFKTKAGINTITLKNQYDDSAFKKTPVIK